MSEACEKGGVHEWVGYNTCYCTGPKNYECRKCGMAARASFWTGRPVVEPKVVDVKFGPLEAWPKVEYLP